MRMVGRLLLLLLGGCTSSADDTGDGVGSDCVPSGVAAVLRDHLAHLDSALGLLVGHPSDREAVSFLEVPGFEGPINYMTLIGPCASAMSYDPYCDPESGICSQIECTGQGAGWVVHMSLDGPAEQGAFEFAAATNDVAWADGEEGFAWTSSSSATSEGVDWSMTGGGSIAPAGASWTWTLSEAFAALVDGGAQLDVTHPGTGQVVASSVIVATVGAALDVTPTGDCP